MSRIAELQAKLEQCFGDKIISLVLYCGQLTMQIGAKDIVAVAKALRDDARFLFEELIDVAGVDYATYGSSQWETETVSSKGFSRAVYYQENLNFPTEDRFGVVYQLLSIKHNLRLRLKVLLSGEPPLVDSLVSIWASANWFEREAFDLLGIIFQGHPDLRRILTDYGFIGHPLRKDFPLSGEVEMRYDASLGRVVYEPVSIEPRTLVPRVIREDHRYVDHLPTSSTDKGEEHA